MTDLYAVLGLPPGADRAAIRRAYRDLAHTAHPDAGGTPEAFAAIKTAHDVLTDDASRQRYDESGEIGRPPTDSHRADLADVLAAGHHLAMLKLARRTKLPKYLDMAPLTRDALRERRGELDDQRRECEKTAGLSRELLSRYSAASGDSLMEAALKARVAACQTQIESLNRFIGLVDEALEVLNGVTWGSEPAPAQPWLSLIETIGTRFG